MEDAPDIHRDRTRQETHALIAHELRAPLTVIKGYLDILRRPMDEESRLAALEAAYRAADRLDTMLDDLLAASADRRVFAPAEKTSVSLRALAHDVVGEVLPLHDHTAEVSGDDGTYSCDPGLMRQVLYNLIGNALKHTPPGGTVRVVVTEAPDRITLVVEDDGPGVARADRERVFELFARLGSPTEMPQGLGLGLPVSRTIVEQHGGSLVLTEPSDGASGARFEMNLPRG